MQQQILIMRSPDGPLAWELRIRESETQYSVCEVLNVLSSNLPEVRCTASLPVLSDSDACRFARSRWFQATLIARESV